MQYHIRAGTMGELMRDSGDWLFVDVGFSSNKDSCGVLKNEESPTTMNFGSLVKFVIGEVQIPGQPLNLLLEAPLSVAFNKDGNPARRSTDKEAGKTPRDWWYNAGASMLLATGHLLRRVKDCEVGREVRLFEGFVSFKSAGSISDHEADVSRLRCAAWDPIQKFITGPDKLKVPGRESDTLESAFKFAGMDFGLPPVVKGCGIAGCNHAV